ncbi:calcium-binding protein [Novosphingobium sp. PASSN1]|uniref:beta strand repeat-containing protein n=1 Tax=Novosphingobium sp. PASSN1 TaxID=2015561 RepID=UPI000BCFA6F0|nr:calcium-binding protein [Novosphingobium sp. PASSN1]OYU35343.1 MAG: hypothetical protein CFE35_10190 [Novosphingobium sp. PASSN1]
MSRSRRLAVDDNNTWLIRAEYLADPLAGPDGTVDHGDVDYIVFASDGSGDEAFTVKPGLYGDFSSVFQTFVVWGKGLVSFGAPTADQIAFMAAATDATDLGKFPGAFIHAGYSDPAANDLYVAIKDPDIVAGADAYTIIEFGSTTITIYRDRVTFSNGAGVVDLGTGVRLTPQDAENGAVRLSHLLSVNGTAGDNVIDATAAPQTIHGLGGNDTIRGGAGASDLYGDAGNDRITGGIAQDRLYGGEGIDTITGSYGDVIYGGGGNDRLSAARGVTVDGGSGVDRLHLDFTGFGLVIDVALPDGTSGTLAAIGTSYTAIEQIDITGGNNNDRLLGNSADNVINGGAGADAIDGGAGNDILDAGIGGPAPEPIVETTSRDSATAIAIDTAFSAVAGASPQAVLAYTEQSFAADPAYYSFDVLAGGDLLIESDNGQPLSAGYSLTLFDADGNQVATNDPGFGLSVADLAAGRYVVLVENQSDSGFVKTGHVRVNLSTATPQVRRNDLTGGSGDDTYLVHAASDRITEKAGQGFDAVIADITWTLSDNVEKLTLKAGAGAINGVGNALANTIVGNEAGNILNGGSGSDTLIGGGGNDFLRGDTGADRMAGGAGDDGYRVDNVLDVVIEKPGEGSDKVTTNVTFTLADNVEILVMAGLDPLSGTGNALANQLFGNAAANLLDGRAGADLMLGGGGGDTYRVDNAGDMVYETVTVASSVDAGGLDTVLSSVTYSLEPNGRQFVENLTLTGTAAIDATGNSLANLLRGNGANNVLSGNGGADTLMGYGGDDRLLGGPGRDTLTGGSGNDVLNPGSGIDTLSGGAGADWFVFNDTAILDGKTKSAADSIADFSHAEKDRIDLRAVDANALVSGDQAFAYRGTAAFTHHAGELRIEASAAGTFLAGDQNGDGSADFYIRLTPGITLIAADFLL